MKKFTLLMSFILLLSWQGMTQTTLYLTTSGGSYSTEKWVNITDGPNGTGTVLWAQGDGTYGNGQGLVTDATFTIVDGTTYYINCYDRYDDGWDGTTYQIRTAAAGGGILVANNGGVSPDDGNDVDASSSWEVMDDERESSEAFSYMPAACMQPSNLSATLVTSNSASLGWIENGTATTWNVEWGTSGFTQGTGNMVSGTTNNPEPITGLSPSTAYEFYVQADCGGAGTSTWAGPFAFTTACGIYGSFPFLETFESSSTSRTCWSQIQVAGIGNWTFATGAGGGSITNAQNGTLNARFVSQSGTNSPITKLVSPTFDLSSLTTPELSFYYGQEIWSPDQNELKVYYRISSTDPWVEITHYTSSVASWTKQTIILPNASASYQIAFEGINNYGRANVIDEVEIKEAPACPDPSLLTTTAVTATSASLGWFENGSATSWNVEWGTSGFTQGTGTMVTGTTNNPEPITGLSPSTAYEFYVQADCGGSGTSAWVGPFAFVSACNAFNVPFQEGFNSSSTTESCWKVVDNNADTEEWDLDYTTSPYEGDQVAIIYTDFNAGANDDYLISPQINLTGNEQLRFYHKVQSGSEPNDFKVKISTTGNNPSDFTTELSSITSSSTTYQEVIINLSAYSVPVYIAFHIPSGGLDGWRLYVDDVNVEALPACPDPSLLTATAVTATSASLGWFENGSATSWNVEWGTSGFTQGTGTMVSGTSNNPEPVTGLSSSTAYEFYVQADCGGSGTSAWVGPFAFTTLCSAPVISSFPWTENFDGVTTPAMPCGWIVDNVNADTYTWITGTTASSAPNSMQVRWNSSEAANDWSFTPELVLVGGQTYQLSFNFAVAGTTFPEKLKVMYGSAQNVAGMTDLLFDSTLTNTVFDTAFATFTPATSGSYYIGFHNYSDANMFRIYVDDVTVEEVMSDTCSMPSNLSASNITPSSALLDWTENGNATEWDIEWGLQGFTLGTGNAEHVVSKPHLLNNVLTPNTAYEFYVRADCGNGDTSLWVGPYLFVTPPCMPIGLELGNDTTLCSNQSLTLNAPAGGPYGYSWSTSESTSSITVDTASLGGNGTYNITVSVIDFSNMCIYNDAINVTFSICTGIKENSSIGFAVYPNPTNGMLTIRANEKGTVEITNLQGKVVYKNTLNSSSQVINLSENAKGVYFVSITTSKGVEVQKIVIQ